MPGRRARRPVRIGHHQHKIGRFEHRGEHLAAGDAVAAVDPPRPRLQRTLADQRGRDRLGEIAGDQLALLHDEIGDAPLGLGRDLGALQQRHDDRGVHVEGECRRRAALAQRLVGDRVVEKAGAAAAPFLADRRARETLPRATGRNSRSGGWRRDHARPTGSQNRRPAPGSAAAAAFAPRSAENPPIPPRMLAGDRISRAPARRPASRRAAAFGWSRSRRHSRCCRPRRH